MIAGHASGLLAGTEKSWLEPYGLHYAGMSPFTPAYMVPRVNFTGDHQSFAYRRNLYWNASGAPLTFYGKTLAEWEAAGQDKETLVTDPFFVDPEHGDFNLKPESPATKVGFKPWKLTTSGPRSSSGSPWPP